MNERRADPISPAERAEPVVVVPYDPAWPAAFELLRDRLAGALGELAAGVEHVGSTAVPGLDAKPIIDVDVVIRRAEHFDAAAGRLAALGYVHLGDLGVVGREAFRSDGEPPRHHLYVCAAGAAALQAHLTLRDALRSDPNLVASYAALKRDLSERYRDDRDSYAEGKTAFITAVLLDERTGRRRSQRKR
ncbi:MAG: dephospho-CoA kinase/protein folding accessory protein [Candidatus Eremiobacteraeota bacterium]|nr:dephospho-CoA kinase/protein folding accessory protein [Candidatus Eremiobacteraeota bacterium]